MGPLYVVVFALGIGVLFTETAQTVLAGHIAVGKQVSQIISRMQSVDQAAALLLPAVAGVAIQKFGSEPLLWITVILSALAILALGRRRSLGTHKAESQSPPAFFQDVQAGFRFLRSNPLLRNLTISSIMTNAGLAVFGAIEVILVLRYFGFSVGFLGLMAAVGASGGLVGATIAGLPTDRSEFSYLVGGSWLMVLATGALMLSTYVPEHIARLVLLTHAFAWGLGVLTTNVKGAAVAIRHIPPQVLGRVTTSRRTLTMGVVPIASVFGGVVADRFGIRTIIVLWIVLTVSAAIVATLVAWEDSRSTRISRA